MFNKPKHFYELFLTIKFLWIFKLLDLSIELIKIIHIKMIHIFYLKYFLRTNSTRQTRQNRVGMLTFLLLALFIGFNKQIAITTIVTQAQGKFCFWFTKNIIKLPSGAPKLPLILKLSTSPNTKTHFYDYLREMMNFWQHRKPQRS